MKQHENLMYALIEMINANDMDDAIMAIRKNYNSKHIPITEQDQEIIDFIDNYFKCKDEMIELAKEESNLITGTVFFDYDIFSFVGYVKVLETAGDWDTPSDVEFNVSDIQITTSHE